MLNYQDLTIALAGVCQSAKLVQQFAHNGIVEQNALETSLNSLLHIQADNTLAIYDNDLINLKLGLETILEQLVGNSRASLDTEIGRYWLGILALEGKLNTNAQVKANLAQRIQYLPTQLQLHNSIDSDAMFNILAEIYVDLISPLSAKIQVTGSPVYLQQPAIHNRIRACLLAGIRSAVLWRQCGGSKWKILFARGKIAKMAQQLYSQL